MTSAVFAIPGDKDQRTGGYIYDATVLEVLNANGCATSYLELPDSFPNPPAEDMSAALTELRAIPKSTPVIIDGLALGAMPPDSIAELAAPVIALVHHPLGLETGLDRNQAARLIQNEKEVLRHVAHVIVTSQHVAQTLVSDFNVAPDRITVANPGFSAPKRRRSPISPPMILSVGLLARRKGHDVLVDALRQVSDLSWQAEIIGRPQDTEYSEALAAQINRHGLETRIKLVGEVGADALEDAYLRASLFALATRYEGYGMVLSEAMQYGLPIVSCKVGAVPDTVGAAGHLVSSDDPDAFAETLRALLQDTEMSARSSRASETQAAALPTWQDTARHFAKVIAEVTP